MPLANIVRLFGAIDYKPQLRFFDRMYTAAHNQENDFEHWQTDRFTVNLFNHDRHELLTLNHKRLSFETINPERPAVSLERLAGRVSNILHDVHIARVNRVGIKLICFADLGLTFDELRTQLRPICIPENPRLTEITSAEITDVSLAFHYTHADSTAALRIGPMTREEGATNLDMGNSVQFLFPHYSKGSGLSQLFDTIPAAFLFFEIDVSRKELDDLARIPTFMSDSLAHAIAVFEGIKGIVEER